MRALGLDPVHDTRRTFDGLLTAMSRPGTVQPVPDPADHAVVATLVDHEVSLHTPDQTLLTTLANEGRLTSAPLDEADIVHAPTPTEGRVREMTRGTRKEPSDGGTVIYSVDRLAPDPPEQSDGTRVAVSGPGVLGERRLGVEGLPPAEAAALADAQARYPRGVDAFLASHDRVAALPRSVDLEVV